MRVIAGAFRGRRLTEFKGLNTRPTPDRVREALFSSLLSRFGTFSNLKVLDLFAGSGALAIEALSRGAASACLVENDPGAVRIIRDNIHKCQLEKHTTLKTKDAFAALEEFPSPFDLVFLDPPYNRGLAAMAAEKIDSLGLLSADGVICAETAATEEMPGKIGSFIRIDRRRYGSVVVHFYSIFTEE